MKIRNLRTYAVEIDDPENRTTYECAARPGVVEVPDALAKSLLKQEDAWTSADDEPKPQAKADDKKEG